VDGVVVYVAAGMAVAMTYPAQATRQPKTKRRR